ncbi:putative proactivator polypeptide [Apostichopus japonicus]|uniref:Putative proactivator polypeptide n=1 Tax=Stichopus japonicus TaxID=307972 RepID=A0A2G8KS40_STIJA|nr:putative proactivator polypeptide [Apostichopus japonicus]
MTSSWLESCLISRNDPCSDCKAFMGDVKTILSNSSVQKMIIEDLENFCNDLGSLAPQCQEYVEQYGSLVFSLILQYFDPNMICSSIGFCKSEEMVMASFDVCTECKTYMGDFVQFLNTPSVQQNVMKQVTSICKMLKISDNCDQVVSEYGPLIMKMLLQYLNPESFCKEIGVCASEAIPEALPEPGDLCTDCQSFVKDFDNLLNNYTIQEMFLKDIEVLCKYVPNYSSDCKMYIEQYGALVFEVIAGLILAPNDVCADCKNLFQDVQNFLSEPDVQKKILGEIELLCNDLGPFGPQCKTYVDQYGPLVFTFLLQYIDPDAICSKVGLCSADLPQSPAKVNADMCADCKAFFTDVSTILNTPQVQG